MGAFDGLKLYQSFPKKYIPEVNSSEFKIESTYYISWDGSNGGATGEHFNNIGDAISCFREKAGEKKHPSAWFKSEQIDYKLRNCGNLKCWRCKES